MNYNQICLVPKFGVLETRDAADVSCEFAGKKWRLPVVPSNMEATIDFQIARWMSDNNYFYILHRFYEYDKIFDWAKNNQDAYISLSVGVQEKDRKFLEQLEKANVRVDCLTLDIAHGFSINTLKMCAYIKSLYGDDVFVIAGNVFGNKESIYSLEDCGVDAIKVGLAFGKACTTYNQTGFASPMFSCGKMASRCASVPIIGDGGIRDNGDIVKGLVAGYTMIMAGSIFAQCIDSPAPFLDNGNKVYFGSASELSKVRQGATNKNVEGRSVEMPCNNMTYADKLTEIEQNLRSAVSYAGGKDLTWFNEVDYVEIDK